MNEAGNDLAFVVFLSKLKYTPVLNSFESVKMSQTLYLKALGLFFCPTVNVACVPYRLIFFPRVDFRYHSRSKFIG